MSRNDIFIPASRAAVFDALCDPWRYISWVVGSRRIRSVDAAWPARNSAFHHQVTFGAFHLSDSTRVLIHQAPERLVLEARARPIGIAEVDITLVEEEGGTRVYLEEVATSGLIHRFSAVLEPFMALRNQESLRRLKRAVEHAESQSRAASDDSSSHPQAVVSDANPLSAKPSGLGGAGHVR